MMVNKTKLEPALEKRYAKPVQKRKPRRIVCKILIVCEGKKTEPNYFNAFKNLNKGTLVYSIDVKGTGTNTINVVDKAIDLRDKASRAGSDYDRVWAVFDKDSFSDDIFNQAIIKANNNNIECAWSNEAFELWYLYHFKNLTTPMSRSVYSKQISRSVNKSLKWRKSKPYKYVKNCPNNYYIMTTFGSQENAIKWAEEQSKKFVDKRFANHNPCTMVFKLVKQLIGKDDKLNQELNKKFEF